VTSPGTARPASGPRVIEAIDARGRRSRCVANAIDEAVGARADQGHRRADNPVAPSSCRPLALVSTQSRSRDAHIDRRPRPGRVDTNANGLQDDGATGIVGATVTLIGGGADGLINGVGDTTATTTTGVDGFYDFSA